MPQMCMVRRAHHDTFAIHKMKLKIAQAGIILFCLWHMSAVLVYAIPRETTDPISGFTREKVLPIVSPYILATSQWQLWNMFSPDPLRRITEYRIDVKQDDTWNTITTFGPGSFPWWQHSNYIKLFNNVFDGTDETLKKRVLALTVCDRFHLPLDAIIRLSYTYAIIPLVTSPFDMTVWKSWQPEWMTDTGPITTCSSL